MSTEALRQHCDATIAGMRLDRYSWWLHWRELADYILPRRYRWLITANQMNRGSPINSNIIDSTGTLAARTLAGGMMSGVTSPTRPWFKLKVDGFEEDQEVVTWLAECAKRLQLVFQESNFYTSMATMWADLTVFGTACVIIYEDFENVIHCFNPCLGEFFFALNDKFEVDQVGREFTMTQRQMIQMFGEDRVSEGVKQASRDAMLGSQEKLIMHLIEPNKDNFDVVPKRFPFREVYWEWGGERDKYLRAQGFWDWPAMTPRWDVTSNDPYGRSQGMDALGDIKQLQQEQRRKAQAIDKMVNPPMIADVSLKNQPMSLLPGGVTYVAGLNTGREGAKPIYTIMPPLGEIKQDIQENQQRIRITFHNDLFTGITDLQTVRTATEIDARREEKLILLGPVLERSTGREGLGAAIDRTWGIMWRGGLLPPPPQSISNMPTHIQVDYISMLAMAQRGIATAAIEKVWGFAGSLAGVRPEILDNLDPDDTIREYGQDLGVTPKIYLSREATKAVRDQRNEQANAQTLAGAAPVAADAAKTLSETDVGGGASALQLILQGGGNAA